MSKHCVADEAVMRSCILCPLAFCIGCLATPQGHPLLQCKGKHSN